MRQIFAILLFTLSAAIIPTYGVGRAQEKTTEPAPGPGNNAELISKAQITKIDAKKKTLKVRNILSNDATSSTSQSNSSSRRSGGAYPGGVGFPGGRRGGVGVPSSRPSGGSSSKPKLGPEYTVYLGKTTTIMDGDHSINLQNFKVGDRVNVTGTQKGSGKDVNATAIARAYN